MRAIGVVEVEKRSLHPEARATERRRVVGTAFDLCQVAFAIFREATGGVTAKEHGGGVKERLAQSQSLGLFHVRKNLVDRLFGAGYQPGEREGRGVEFEKIAPTQAVPPFGSALGKFAMKAFAKFRCVRDFFQAAPVMLAAHAV